MYNFTILKTDQCRKWGQKGHFIKLTQVSWLKYGKPVEWDSLELLVWWHVFSSLRVPRGPERHPRGALRSRRGGSLVHGQLGPGWNDPGGHPPPLPGILPVRHGGVRWLEPAGQRSEAGQLAEGRTVRTWYHSGKSNLDGAVESDPP